MGCPEKYSSVPVSAGSVRNPLSVAHQLGICGMVFKAGGRKQAKAGPVHRRSLPRAALPSCRPPLRRRCHVRFSAEK